MKGHRFDGNSLIRDANDVRYNWTVTGDADMFEMRLGPPLDMDGFNDHLGLEPVTLELVLSRILWVDFFDKEIFAERDRKLEEARQRRQQVRQAERKVA